MINVEMINNKQIEEFLKKWSKELINVENILKYIATYPELLLKQLEIDDLIKPAQLIENQKLWIDSYSKFNNPIEKSFFKPYWIPLQPNSYGVFLDMSNTAYPLFETRYFFYEPYQWYKKYLVKNIYELLLSVDDDKIDIDKIMKLNDKERWSLVMELFNKN